MILKSIMGIMIYALLTVNANRKVSALLFSIDCRLSTIFYACKCYTFTFTAPLRIDLDKSLPVKPGFRSISRCNTPYHFVRVGINTTWKIDAVSNIFLSAHSSSLPWTVMLLYNSRKRNCKN